MTFIKSAAVLAILSSCPAFAQTASTPISKDLAPEMAAPKSFNASASLDAASAYMFDSGYVVSDGLVLQPALNLGFTSFESIPVKCSLWANYATEKSGFMTQSHAFTEIDLGIGSFHRFENGITLSGDLKTSQYPNMEGWKGVDFLNGKIFRKFDFLTIGSRVKYLLTGDYSSDCHLIPFAEVGTGLFNKTSASLNAQACYFYTDGNAPDAWTACTITAKVKISDFYLYTKYLLQMDDTIYTDKQHDVEDTIFGVGYTMSL